MERRIEDYAFIGDCRTGALVHRDGSIDWYCPARFDSDACFAALLGTPDHGHWSIAPVDTPHSIRRQYRGQSLVLETVFETSEGSVSLIDCMPLGEDTRWPQITRIVRGRTGTVRMRMELVIRFEYGSIVPWVTRHSGGLHAVAGPHALLLHADVPIRGENRRSVAEFSVDANDNVAFTLIYAPSEDGQPVPIAPSYVLERTEGAWQAWSERCRYEGPYREAVQRSLLTLKALTYGPTGAIVAAPTTSLPESLGGMRNWDYRFCWIRDAAITLDALLGAGYTDEARAWREWLLRAVAGAPEQLQVIYGIHGERHLTEYAVPWLPGYGGARPVRIGNDAHHQLQLDVFGELLDAMHECRKASLENVVGWALERALLDFLESRWQSPDSGIWEMRGPARHFTYSKVMAWVAFDRAIRAVETSGREGPVERWRAIRQEIHAEVCTRAYSRSKRAFVQTYGSEELDASLLKLPLVGFVPADDERVRGTVAAIERELVIDRTFVRRYRTNPDVDGLPPGEGTFLACSFWLANNWALQGRYADARALFERLLRLRNDVGLLAEEYEPRLGRQLGNFPQAFSHLALVNTAQLLDPAVDEPAASRA